MRSIAASTYSVGTGRLCRARMKPVSSLLRLNSERLPSCFTTCGNLNSTVSYVVKRFSQLRQRRRRRTLLPSSLTRESTTLVSSALQNGHFIVQHSRGVRRNQALLAANYSRRVLTCAGTISYHKQGISHTSSLPPVLRVLAHLNRWAHPKHPQLNSPIVRPQFL